MPNLVEGSPIRKIVQVLIEDELRSSGIPKIQVEGPKIRENFRPKARIVVAKILLKKVWVKPLLVVVLVTVFNQRRFQKIVYQSNQFCAKNKYLQ